MSWPEIKKINSDPMTPLNEGGVKIVKSIQRGAFTADTSGNAKTVAISTVDASKAHVTLWDENYAYMSGTTYVYTAKTILKSIDNNSFTVIGGNKNVNGSGPQSQKVYYEIIEFY